MRRVIVALCLIGLLPSCSEDPQALLGRTWILDPSSIAILGIEVPAGTRVDLVFQDDGTAAGTAGCNTYGAGYDASGADLSFDEIRVTAMACQPSSLMTLEAGYLDLLAQTDSFQIASAGSSLILSGGPRPLGFTAEGSEPARD
jgi:heat shock protein HslJ